MNLSVLRYFRAVARSGQMTQAAVELKIAQPAISRAIKRLETEVGQPLFVRHNNRIALNAAGQVLLQATDSILDTWDTAMDDIQHMATNNHQEIVMNVSSAGSSVPSVLQEFRKAYPHVTFTIYGQHCRAWEETDCDLYLFSSFQKLQAPSANLLREEQLYLSISTNHPFAKKVSVSLRDCKGLPFLFPDLNNDMYSIQMHYCNLAGFSPQIALTIEKQNILLNLLALNQGVSLLPRMPAADTSGITQLPIDDIECYRYIYVVLNSRRPYNANAAIFQQFCVDYYKRISE